MTKKFTEYKKQVANIRTENDLKDAHIRICQDASLPWSEFMKLCDLMRAKRVERGIAWGKSI